MAIGCPQVAFVEARLEAVPKEDVEAMQRLLYWARTGVELGASAAPDGEEARALFLAWEEMGPLLAYAPEDPEWQAVAAMRDLRRDLYSDAPPLIDRGAFVVTRDYRAYCCKAACQSNYLLYLEEDVTTAVANAAPFGGGFGGSLCGCGRKSKRDLEMGLQRSQGPGGEGVPGATSLEREAEVVLQVWQWWFLKFDLPFRTQGIPHVAPCTMATLMSTHNSPTMSLPSEPQLLSALSMDPATMEVMMEKMMEKMTNKVVWACVCVFLLASRAHFVSVCFVENLTGASLFLV